MCGIAGAINLPISTENLQKIKHRGPDSMGLNMYDIGKHFIYFGQTRLSIVDLSDAGFQPMTDKSEKYTILLNGEIYNHEELRKSLKNVDFIGHSDTETVLYYLIQNGIQAVSNLNGIFSIAFLDHDSKKLFIVRDPFGVKPLYYYHKQNQLIFASEIRIIQDLINDLEIDQQCFYNYLRVRFCPSPFTLYKDILKLEPGHFLEFDCSIENIKMAKQFYSYKPKKNYKISFENALDQYDELVRSAVKRQLMSDVPIAIMLSGGVDSALLAFLAQDISGNKLDTFSIGFDVDSDVNELIDAANSAKWLGSRHNEIIIDQSKFKNESSEFIRVIEEPVGSQSLYPFYELTKEIHEKGFKVALSGQGVDEAMAGYKRYNYQNFFDQYSSPLLKFLKISLPFIKNDKIRRGLNALTEIDRTKRFIESYSFFDKKTISDLLKIEIKDIENLEKSLVNILNEKANLYDLNQNNGLDFMLMMDTRLALTDDLLLYTDKISMNHSLEVRVPFLDLELMEFVESLPTSYKSTITKNKILHKKLAERYLPDEIIYRKKKGFYIPRKEWYKSESGDFFRNEINSDTTGFKDFMNINMIDKMFEDHKKNKYNYEDQIYSIMNLFYWFKNKNVK
jgi:asparagine synthase (glutamine-hydrolysing)